MRRISVVLFYLGIFIGLAEMTLRYYFSGVGPSLIKTHNPAILGEFLPNQSILVRPGNLSVPRVRVLTNQEGLRLSGSIESENSKEPVDAPAKVLCVGDEITFGLGVPDEETYPTLLRGILQSRAGRPYQIQNGGVPGYHAKEERDFLKNKLPLLSSGSVILQISSNDLIDSENALEGKDVAVSATDWQIWLRKNLALYNGFLFLNEGDQSKKGAKSPHRNIQSPVDFFGEPRDLSQLMREWQKTGDLWQEMCLALKRNNKNIIVVAIPHPRQMKDGLGGDLYQNPIKQIFSRECQVSVVDPLDKFRRASQSTPLFFENSHVLNRAGNLLLAQILAEELLPQ